MKSKNKLDGKLKEYTSISVFRRETGILIKIMIDNGAEFQNGKIRNMVQNYDIKQQQ